MIPTWSRKTSRISWNEFDEAFLDNVGLDSGAEVNVLLAAGFVVERFTGLPSFAPCCAALLRASFSAERLPL